ncbi:hypothetical protein BFP75_19700 [Maribacter sp. 4G9]|nr:hypothetical protein BFP75_19700 [Maribacter sp. 4G9]
MKDIKLLLPWKGSFLLQHVLSTLEEIKPTKISVVLGANASKIKERLQIDANSTEIFENPTWKNGLGNSISVGVRHILASDVPPKGILICLADQPLVTKEYLGRLLLEFTTQDVAIVASKYEKRMGVPAVFSPSIYPELLNLNSDFGARVILEKYKTSILGMEAKGFLADIDTPEDYEDIYNQNHHQ